MDPADVLPGIHGHPAEHTVRRLQPVLGAAQVTEQTSRLLALEISDLADIVPTPGAERLLTMLEQHAVPWAVVTSAPQQLAHARLAAAGINAHPVITVDDVTTGKPDPGRPSPPALLVLRHHDASLSRTMNQA
jgi:sugar-phosphatase